MSAFREKIFVLSSKLVDAAGGIFFLKLISNLVPKSQVGEYLLMASLLAIITTVSTSALDVGIMRHVDEYRRNGTLSGRYSAALGTYAVVGMLFVITSFFLSQADVGGDNAVRWLPTLAAWFICEAVRGHALNMASTLRARARVLLVGVVEQTVKLGLLYFLATKSSLALQSVDVVHIICAASLLSALTCICAQRDMLSVFHWSDARSTFSDSIKFVWPMMMWGGFSWFQNMSSRWFLQFSSGAADVAEFGVFVTLANFPIAAMLGVFVAYLLPILYEQENREAGSSRKLVKRAAVVLGIACAVLLVGLSFFHRELVVLITNHDYGEHSYVIPWLMFSISISALGSVFALSVYVDKKLRFLVAANTVPGISVILLNYFLIESMGFVGAAVSFCIGNILAGILFYVAYLMVQRRGDFKVRAAS